MNGDGAMSSISPDLYDVTVYDAVNGAEYDVAEDEVWFRLLERMERGLWDALLLSPPSDTFDEHPEQPAQDSARRRGPGPVRGLEGRDIYGLKSNSP